MGLTSYLLGQRGEKEAVAFLIKNGYTIRETNFHSRFGEIDIIAPAVEKAKLQNIEVDGPFPSDTLYLKVRDGQFDCAVSMYHDQGQIAIKLLGFDQGVSVLAGLPVPITTPAHGTAFDIVGTNSANVSAALNAFRMVAAMAQGRNHRHT